MIKYDPTLQFLLSESPRCPETVDTFGVTWRSMLAGETAQQPCPVGYYGKILRDIYNLDTQ